MSASCCADSVPDRADRETVRGWSWAPRHDVGIGGRAAPGAKPGVIISYNCDRFACEPELVDRLSRIVEGHPDGVYLAPYPRMRAKIALTTLGKSETLHELDEARINAFIAQRG